MKYIKAAEWSNAVKLYRPRTYQQAADKFKVMLEQLNSVKNRQSGLNKRVPDGWYEDYLAVSEYLLTSYFNLYEKASFVSEEYEPILSLIQPISSMLLKAAKRFGEKNQKQADIARIITLSASFCERTSGKASESCGEAEDAADKTILLDNALKWVNYSIALLDEHGLKIGFNAFLLKLEILGDRYELSKERQNLLGMLELIGVHKLLTKSSLTPEQRLCFFAVSLCATKECPEERLSRTIVKAAMKFASSASFPGKADDEDEAESLKGWLNIFENRLADNLEKFSDETTQTFPVNVAAEEEEEIELVIDPRRFISSRRLEKMPIEEETPEDQFDFDQVHFDSDTDEEGESDPVFETSRSSESLTSSEEVEEVIVIVDDEEEITLTINTETGRKKRKAASIAKDVSTYPETGSSPANKRSREVEVVEVCLETPDTDSVIEEEVILFADSMSLMQAQDKQSASSSSSAPGFFTRKTPSPVPVSAPGVEIQKPDMQQVGQAFMKVLNSFTAKAKTSSFKPIVLSFMADFMLEPRQTNQPAIALYLYRQVLAIHPKNDKIINAMLRLSAMHPKLHKNKKDYECEGEDIFTHTLITFIARLNKLYANKPEAFKDQIEKLLEYLKNKLKAWEKLISEAELDEQLIKKFEEELGLPSAADTASSSPKL